MEGMLGSRTIYYVDENGVSKPITLHIEFSPIESFDLGDSIAHQAAGLIHFDGNWKSRSIKAYGEDRIQVAYRLMCLAEATIRRISRDCNLNFFKIIPGDIKEPMDVFS